MKKATTLISILLLTPLLALSMENQNSSTNLQSLSLENRKLKREKEENTEDVRDRKRQKFEIGPDAAEATGWDNLPIELQYIILAFIEKSLDRSAIDQDDSKETTKLLKIVNAYASLSLVNKQFNEFTSNENLFNIPLIINRLRTYLSNIIYEAARTNNLKKLTSLLKNGLILHNNTDSIFIASRLGHIKFCKKMIIAGVFEGATNVKLIQAICLHDFNAVKNLIKLGKKNKYKGTAYIYHADGDIPEFIIAIYVSDFDILKLLLESLNDKNLVNYQTVAGETPLTIACRNGDKNIVELLLEHGADINQENRFGYTPLQEATFKWHLAIREFLLSRGAKPKPEPGIISIECERCKKD